MFGFTQPVGDCDKRTTTLREPLRGTWKQATRSVSPSPPYGKPPSVSMGLSLTLEAYRTVSSR
ncbi:MAG: hypothetical protein HC903_04910 [Methylacidiphilales bacterium]|nr:hypothetical protein [Candidatus Methylacidiphilales bacterium]